MILTQLAESYSQSSNSKMNSVAHPILNTYFPVNDSKSGTYLNGAFEKIGEQKRESSIEKKGGQNARQTSVDLR